MELHIIMCTIRYSNENHFDVTCEKDIPLETLDMKEIRSLEYVETPLGTAL